MRAAFISTLSASVMLFACHSPQEGPPIAFERLKVAPVQFGLGPNAKTAAVRSLAEWQSFCGDGNQDLSATARNFDWSSRMLIAVSLGSRPSGGFAVQIERVVQHGSDVIVHVRETRPAPGTYQTAMITTPFDCVSAPKFEGNVVFRFE